MSTETGDDKTLREMSAWASLDLMDDIITAENFPGPGDPQVLAWIEGLGLDPLNIPAEDVAIDPKKMRLYWREFHKDADGARVRSATSADRYRRTSAKSMQLDSLPPFLN